MDVAASPATNRAYPGENRLMPTAKSILRAVLPVPVFDEIRRVKTSVDRSNR